jgi:hypothetical protein
MGMGGMNPELAAALQKRNAKLQAAPDADAAT